jgi:tetratricopeptide (TPR) repeat protein
VGKHRFVLEQHAQQRLTKRRKLNALTTLYIHFEQTLKAVIMNNVRTPQVEKDPAPEFNQRCVSIVRSWQHGDLPFADAVAQMTRLSDEARRSGHAANEGRAEHALGFLQHYRGNLNTSIQHYERARSLFRRVNNLDRVGTMDLNQGENYRFKGDFMRALRLYRSAHELAKSTGNVNLQTMAAVNEGLVLLAVGDNTSALNAFTAALQLTDQWEDRDDPNLPGLLCELYHGVAVVFLRQQRFRDAWENALRALEIASSTELPHQLGYANRTIGEVITELGQAPDSGFSNDPDDYFQAAMKCFKTLNEEAELARTMYAHALSMSHRGRRTMAAKKLQQVMIIFTRLGMVDDIARAAEAQLAVI